MASRARVLVVAALVALCAAAASVAAQPPATPRPLPSNYHVITPGKYRRDQQLACNDDRTNNTACLAKCDRRCPNQCIVLCPGCKTFCSTHKSLLCLLASSLANRSLVDS
jgi:hypothetical protein